MIIHVAAIHERGLGYQLLAGESQETLDNQLAKYLLGYLKQQTEWGYEPAAALLGQFTASELTDSQVVTQFIKSSKSWEDAPKIIINHAVDLK